MRTLQRNSQPATLTELKVGEVSLRVLVSEPDASSRRLICALLQSDARTKVTCVDDSQLLPAVEETAPDLVIVDVHSPSIRRAINWQMLGFQFAPVTIVTGLDPSAVSAFASNAVDFLVKPFNVERLESAFDLATAAISRRRAAATEPLSHAEQGVEERRFLRRLAVEAGEKIVLLRTEDIEWLQAAGNNIRVHLREMNYLRRGSLKYLQSLLDPNRFLRVHRNAIVNLDHVEEFHLPTQGNMFVKLKHGACLPLQRANRALLRRILRQHFVA